ncbi:MAG: TauD/TfdA dioxygenase family protein [Acidimicrobiales bacterium]
MSAALTVTPHDGACGATVTGVALAELDAADFAAIEHAFHTYGVLAFPDQHLSDEEHAAFSRRFGPLELTDTRKLHQPGPKSPFIQLANVNRAGETVADPEAKQNQFLRANQFWHTDSSFKRIGAKASLLNCRAAPSSGGETEYADMRAGYEALDRAQQARLEGLVAVHSIAFSQSLALGAHDVLSKEENENLPPVEHPVVRVHEPTGRRSLYVGRHVWRIHGMDDADARQLVEDLVEAACRPPRVYTHRWSAGDLVMWDNRCMLHRGRPWDVRERRLMRRTTIAGAAPPGDVNEWALPD